MNYLNTDPYIINELRKHSQIDYEFHNEKYSSRMTACHPNPHHILSLERDITLIKKDFDFLTIDTPYLRSTLISSDNKISIVEGMSAAFVNPSLYDISIFLYTDGETELERRSRRDVAERGADLEHIKKSHKQRRIQYELFMHPYSESFDIIINNSCAEKDKEIAYPYKNSPQ
ncbi:uridine kinase [Alkalicoccus daliensis]|uniref:Uridine kinase n=1 Tax=Alkalicoccus daliensis TaxID=745820 RepID=A0A1H0D6I3_9BACI|nr:uridine kinase [Alkalicoccus daliensis]